MPKAFVRNWLAKSSQLPCCRSANRDSDEREARTAFTSAPDETTIVTAVISMGRSLKLRVVAEGVETQEELVFLQAHQCDEAQGYYFSRPVLPEQFASLLRTGIPEASVLLHR